MHITRVLVHNFRNFKELLVDPYPRAAVIVGANGLGKSNRLYTPDPPPKAVHHLK